MAGKTEADKSVTTVGTDVVESVPAQRAAALDTYGLSFAELIAGADVAAGADLVQTKMDLVGVPFVITSVTYRDGHKNPVSGKVTNYVSVEIRTADADTWTKRKRRNYIPADCPFGPDETLIFNDGSTGIARGLTEYLHAKGLINVGEVGEKTGGSMNTSPFDRHRSEWATPYGPDDDDPTFNIRLVCLRGLRASEYVSEATDAEATTFYIG